MLSASHDSRVSPICLPIEAQLRTRLSPCVANLKRSSCAPEVALLGRPQIAPTVLQSIGAIVHEVSNLPLSKEEKLQGLRRYSMGSFLEGTPFRADIMVCDLDALEVPLQQSLIRAIRRSVLPSSGNIYVHSEKAISDVVAKLAAQRLEIQEQISVPAPAWLAVFKFKG